MKKIYSSIALLLVAGITASVWYAERPEADISYGPQDERVIAAPQQEALDAENAAITEQSEAVSARAIPQDVAPVREAAPACDAVRISVEGAVYAVCAEREITVFEAMQRATAEGLSFTGAEHSGLGFYVESINGKKAEGGYYWFLYINDESSGAGVSQTLVRPGDAIEWRYKNSY